MGGSSKKQIIAYKYYCDLHIVLGLSNFDYISHIWFAESLTWLGKSEGSPNGYSQIVINKPGLFGGEKREGGVAGSIDIGMGYPNQPRNNYLVSRLGNDLMPAYRGVVSMIFKNFWFGNNPYLKALKVRAQAIHKLSDGSQQWYDEKAEIYNWKQSTITAVYDYDLQANDPNNAFDTELGTLPQQAPPEALFVTTSSKLGDRIHVTLPPGRTWTAWTAWPTGTITYDKYINGMVVLVDGAQDGLGVPGPGPLNTFDTPELARAAFGKQTIDGGTNYAFYISDSPISDNRGGLSLHVEVESFASTGDINPIHFIRECHTDTIWGGGYPDSKMGDSYITAADTIFDEGFGVSFLFTEEIQWREIIEEIVRHIDAISYQDPETGLMEIKLIRDDYQIEDLPVLDPSNSDLQSITKPLDNEVFNHVIIEFWNRETGKDDSITLSDAAAVDMVGQIKHKTYQYSGISNKRVATMVGERDLARSSRPFHQGKLKTNRSVANLKPGDPFVLNSPDDNITQMVCRVTKRSESGLLNGDISIEFGEDIFGQVFTTFADPPESSWVDPIGVPQQFSHQTVFEIPYYLIVQDRGEAATDSISEDACFLGFIGTEPPTGAHIDYDYYVYPDGTTQPPETEFSLTAAFTPFAIVTSSAEPDEILVSVEPLSGMDSVRSNQLIFVGDNTDDQREVLALDGAVSDGDLLINIKRGLIDTVPMPIPAGTVLYFAETFAGESETEYMPGEVIEAYGTPTNGQGAYLGPYVYHDLTMVGRFGSPYPPGNFTINNVWFPGDWYVPPTNQIVFDWAYRDRILQSDQPIDWFDSADYGPEVGTTYLFEADVYNMAGELIEANWLDLDLGLVKTYTLDLDVDVPPAGTQTIVVRLWAVCNSKSSIQAATYTFLIPGIEILADENTGLPILDVDGNYILMEQP